MNKVVVLFSAIISCLLCACKNPFEIQIEETQRSVMEIVHNKKIESAEKDCGYVQIKLKLSSGEVTVLSKLEDDTIILSTSKEYDKYWWLLGDGLLSDSAVCRLEISEWSADSYPVVLYVLKDSRVYSGVFYLDNCGKEIRTDFCRTILPDLTSSSFTDVQLTVQNNQTGECEKSEWKSASELFSQKQKIIFGEYTFKLEAKIGSLKFSGAVTEYISEDISKVSVEMELTEWDTRENGTLKLKVCGNGECSFESINMILYKWENKDFVLKRQMDMEANQTITLTELTQGIYWLRIDGLCENGTKRSYYVAYVYVLPGVTVSKTVELKYFWNLYEVNFETAGGLFIQQQPVYHYAAFETFSLPGGEDLFKPGFTFAGWYYDENYEKPAEEVFTSGMLTENITLYARWDSTEKPEEYPCGAGLLPGRKAQITQAEDCINIKLSDEGNIDTVLIDMYELEGEKIEIKINNLSKTDDFFLIELYSVLTVNKVYLLEITGINKSSDKLVFKEKQFLKV